MKNTSVLIVTVMNSAHQNEDVVNINVKSDIRMTEIRRFNRLM